MNTWEFDENDELKFNSDSALELEKINLYIQHQEVAIRTALINELIAREDAELERLFGDDIGYIPSIPMSLQEECECEKRDIPEVPC